MELLRWYAPDGPLADLLTRPKSRNTSLMCLQRFLISRPQAKISPLYLCSVPFCHFLPLPSFPHFSLLLSLFHFRSPLLSLWGFEKECSSAGGDLTQQKSWLWLCGAIYKWLVINPRPTLMLSQILSFPPPRHAHLHASGCLAYRHMLTDVIEKRWGSVSNRL